MHLLAVGDVAGDGNGLAAGRGDAANDLIERLPAARRQHDRRPRLGGNVLCQCDAW